MEDDGLPSPYYWVLSCQCDPARAPPGGRVCRPWLLYTVQSNFAFKLFEFFSVPNFPRPKSTMTRAFDFSRFVFTLLLLLTFFIWLWHVWTGFYFDLLYFEFRTSKQCGLEPCKCHELNFSGLLLLFSFFSPFSSDYGMFGQDRILIFLIWHFCQANNVDWNPAFVRSRRIISDSSRWKIILNFFIVFMYIEFLHGSWNHRNTRSL